MADNQQEFRQRDGVELREYFERCMADQARFVESRLAAIEKATSIATSALEARLAGMNEFRDALKDQSAHMATRKELDGIVGQLMGDIADLKNFRATQEGKASQSSVNTALLLSLAGLLVGAVSLVMRLAGS